MEFPPYYHYTSDVTPAIIAQDAGGEHGRTGVWRYLGQYLHFDFFDVFGDDLPDGGQTEGITHRLQPRSPSDLASVLETGFLPGSPSSTATYMSTATHGTRIWSPNISRLSSWSSWPSFVENNTSGFNLEATHGKDALDPENNNPFAIFSEDLVKLIKERDLDQLHIYGAIGGIANGLLVDCAAGLNSSSDDSLLRGNRPRNTCTHSLRRTIFGKNRLPEKEGKSIWGHAIDAVKDRTTALLLFVELLMVLARIFDAMPFLDMVPSILILSVVLSVNILLAYRIERKFAAALSKQKEDRSVWVIRSGSATLVSVYDVMVGDILMLKQGDRAPADGILISGHNIECDESCNTGESRQIAKVAASEALEFRDTPLNKRRHDPFIISGSRIVAGESGRCLVTCVGVNSTHGRLMLAIPKNTEETPLQQRLGVIAKMIGNAAIIVAILLCATLINRSRLKVPNVAADWYEYDGMWTKIMSIVDLASTVVFVAVPEGLPIAVFITLFFAYEGMKRDNNRVKKLSSCETMGNATTVCCDKTGTLTTNEMTVAAGTIGTAGRFWDAAHSPEVCSEVRDILAKSAAINSSVFLGDKDGKTEYIGSSTEIALVRIAEQCFGSKSFQQEKDGTEVVETFPFDSTRKCMATVTKVSENLYRMYVKGAPEMLLEKSDRTIEDPSQLTDIPMTKERHNIFMDAITEYASASLRTLGLAYRDFSAWPTPDSGPSEKPDLEWLFQQAFQGLTFLGVLGVQDPIRPGVKDAVERCQGAGVVVRMVTGDNVNTAIAVATECGILDQDGLVLEGSEFRALSDDEMKKILPRLQVLARSSPEDKKLIVLKLKELGETVAVTGDGTNDGPALRAADVGFAMGVSGTDVAKEASSIVLLDDNFASIVSAVAWGRAVINGIRRFLQFQLTANVAAVTLTFVSAVSSASQQPILTNAQLFWVNLIMDAGAALALATDGPTADVMKVSPEKRTAPLLSLTSWKMIFGQASYQVIVGLYMNFHGREALGYPPADPKSTTGDAFATLFFNMFIWMQFFNLINSRRVDNKLNVLEGALKNKLFIAIVLLIGIGQVSFILFGGQYLQLQWLDASEWALSVGLGFVSIPLGMVIRCIPDEALQSFGERTASKSRPVMMRVTPYLSTAVERVRDGSPLRWLQQAGRCIVLRVRAMPATGSLPNERDALLEWQDMV